MEKGKPVIEYYHRAVVCHLIGHELVMPLDLEMILPGEDEVAAAKRLMQRVFRNYARFFDAVVADSLYMQGPFFNLCLEHRKHVVAILKGEHRVLLQDAQGLFRSLKPGVWNFPPRRVVFWEAEGFDSCEQIPVSLRVLHTEETTRKRQRKAGQWIKETEQQSWWCATTIPSALLPTRQLYQVMHHRWETENNLINVLATNWHLDHCFKHDPTAILNFVLTLFIAFTLLQSFYQRNLKPQRRKYFTLIAIALELYFGLADPNLRAPWLEWLRAPAT